MGILDALFNAGKTFLEGAARSHAKTRAKVMEKHGIKDTDRRSSSSSSRSSRETEPSIGDKTLKEWERSWKSIGILSSANISDLSKYVGLYRATLGSKVVYVGRAIEYDNGGLRKRLSDYTRKSNSARKHKSGRLMNEHASELNIEVLITGGDQEAVDTAKKLEKYFIGKHSPEWNSIL